MVAAATQAPLIKSLAVVAPALPTRADVLENLGGEQGMAALLDGRMRHCVNMNAVASRRWYRQSRRGWKIPRPAVITTPTPIAD